MYPFASDGDDDNVDEDDSIPGSHQLLSDEGVVFHLSTLWSIVILLPFNSSLLAYLLYDVPDKDSIRLPCAICVELIQIHLMFLY